MLDWWVLLCDCVLVCMYRECVLYYMLFCGRKQEMLVQAYRSSLISDFLESLTLFSVRY